MQGQLERLDETVARVDRLETDVDTVLPWIGVEGQLRVRLERAEQAILALISDPANPFSAAEKAQAIITSIPVPQG